MKTIFHHCAYQITSNSFELVLELFEKLGCPLVYRKGNERWGMVEQVPGSIRLQIIEIDLVPISNIEDKKSSHIGFISSTPQKDIAEIQEWAEERKIRFRQGGWSDRELWFDFPDIFVNFVIEIMNTSILEDD